jgi:hypothetical protein
MCTAVLIGWSPATPHVLAHIRGRYWSAKIDDISLWPSGRTYLFSLSLSLCIATLYDWLLLVRKKLPLTFSLSNLSYLQYTLLISDIHLPSMFYLFYFTPSFYVSLEMVEFAKIVGTRWFAYPRETEVWRIREKKSFGQYHSFWIFISYIGIQYRGWCRLYIGTEV